MWKAKEWPRALSCVTGGFCSGVHAIAMALIKYQILPERNLIVFTVDGSVTVEDFFETWDKVLADEEFIKGMDSLWDVRNGSFTAITGEHLYSVGDVILRDIDRRGDNYKVAFVVQGQFD